MRFLYVKNLLLLAATIILSSAAVVVKPPPPPPAKKTTITTTTTTAAATTTEETTSTFATTAVETAATSTAATAASSTTAAISTSTNATSSTDAFTSTDATTSTSPDVSIKTNETTTTEATAATDTTSTATTTTTTTTTTSTTAKTNDKGAILVIGDSWGALSGKYLEHICGASTTRPMQNDAKSGSTAKAWSHNRLGVQSMEQATLAYKYVWLSLGGNDFLNSQCDISLADKIADNVVNVIKQVVDSSLGVASPGQVSLNHDIQILYFGYSLPSSDVCGQGKTDNLFAKQEEIIFDAIRQSDYSEYVTLIDISDMFVTSESSPLSDPSYYVDAIHLNEDGYMKLFSDYRVQWFFGCSVKQMAEVAVVNAAYLAESGQLPVGVIAGVTIAVVSVIMLFLMKRNGVI